jgi:hypothetical protein
VPLAVPRLPPPLPPPLRTPNPRKSPTHAPRGAESLLSPNRLNVAVSRAQALAIVVGSPELVEVRCKSVEETKLVNLLCRLVQCAEGLH